MQSSYKRKRLWVDPPFQGRLLLRMGFYLMVYSVVIWHFGFAFEAMRDVVSHGATKSFGDLYTDYFWKQVPLLYTFVLLVPALMYNLLKFSNRIAGPLFRCRTVMRDMAAGKPVGEFKPRKNDLMEDLFAAFNGLIKEWNKRADVIEEVRKQTVEQRVTASPEAPRS